MVLWYLNEFHEVPSRLVGIFNENSKHKASLGMRKGASDLLYYTKDKDCIGIEVKAYGTIHTVKHLTEQAEFLLSLPKKGFFVDSLEMFKNIILTGQGGIDPRAVLRHIGGRKSSIKWDSSLFC